MTREREEYLSNKGKNKTFKIFLKVFGVIVTLGCVIVGLFFLLMVAFPKGGWVEIFY